ncbi:site-specific integrase [Halorussus halophilus]|uniref:site-specific integrase n=1 Tax=Halorussus halophilus TaxID=2650975 RepID=UPI00130132A4|nr:site-specific integrase [Halorussus halophilus]
MTNINDTNNVTGKLERQWELLEEAEIDERDREAIREFVELHRRSVENCAPNTLINDLTNLRMASKRAETPLREMDMKGVRKLLSALTTPKNRGGYGLDPDGGGIFGYKRALRVFFDWLDDDPDYGDYEFAERIELPSQQTDRVGEDQMLEPSEVEKLKEKARNPRDRALIQFLADTGARISLASQLRVGDIHDLDTNRPTFTPNPDGRGHKGAPDKNYPILYSRAELRAYINQHHVDTRPEAPLWHVLRGYDHENPQESAVAADRIRDMLRECRRRTDIDKRVTPHTFRHTALTRLSRAGHSPQEIMHIAGWADERMLERYDHTSDEERNERLRAEAGFIDEPEVGTNPPTPKTCTNCREKVGPEARFCPTCGSPVTDDARNAVQRQEDEFFESAARTDELVEEVQQVRQLLHEFPALRSAVTDC